MIIIFYSDFSPALLNAEHSVIGDVRDRLLYLDEERTELNLNEWITLEFATLPLVEGMERSFVFVSRGRYESLPDTTVLEGKRQIPPMKKSSISSVNTSANDVKEYKLSQNYPNPFNPVTSIHYTVKEPGFVSLKLHDLLGREVATVVNEYMAIGNYTINFDASSAYRRIVKRCVCLSHKGQRIFFTDEDGSFEVIQKAKLKIQN